MQGRFGRRSQVTQVVDLAVSGASVGWKTPCRVKIQPDKSIYAVQGQWAITQLFADVLVLLWSK